MNLFQAGEIWGKIIANMFQNTISPSSWLNLICYKLYQSNF
jgi:hypothetical protein